jgi:hypothetical protein
MLTNEPPASVINHHPESHDSTSARCRRLIDTIHDVSLILLLCCELVGILLSSECFRSHTFLQCFWKQRKRRPLLKPTRETSPNKGVTFARSYRSRLRTDWPRVVLPTQQRTPRPLLVYIAAIDRWRRSSLSSRSTRCCVLLNCSFSFATSARRYAVSSVGVATQSKPVQCRR